MFLLSAPAQILALVFLASVMLSIGMQARLGDLRSLFANRSLLVRVLVANFVLVPLVGIALARLLPIPRASAAALLLLGCTPGGLTAIKFTRTVKSEGATAVGILLLLCVLSLLVSPTMIRLALPGNVDLVVPYGRVLAFIVLGPVLVLAIGMLVRKQAPVVAGKLAGPLGLLGLLCFIGFVVLIKSYRKEAVASIGGAAVGAMLAFILAAMAIGWLLGGPGRDLRQIVATTTSVRNGAFCLVIAASTPGGDAVLTPLVAFTLLLMMPNMIFTIGHTIARKRATRKAAA